VALFQSVVLSQLDLWGGRPDLVLLVVLVWAVTRGVDEGMVWGFIGGLIVDLLSGGPFGTTMLALLIVAWMAGQPWGQGIGLVTMRLLLVAFIAALAYHLVLLLVLAWTGYPIVWARSILGVTIPSALLNAVLAPFVRWPLNWLERSMRRERFAL
jgi:rod shape-determining protein MreD